MVQYYALLHTSSQAFILHKRFMIEGVPCELTYIPRELIKDLCNMGIRFNECDYASAMNIIRRSCPPGCKVYREITSSDRRSYVEVTI